MKIVYNKKKILIVIIPVIFLIILLVAGYFVLQRYSVLGFGKQSFNRYSDIVDLCDKQRDGLKLNVNCKSFLELVEREDDNICFKLSVLNKSNRLSNIKICEKEDIVSWDSKTMVPGLKIPVSLGIEYGIHPTGSNTLEKVSLSLLNDAEIFSWLDELKDLGITLTDVRTNEFQEVMDKGYVLSDLDIDGKKGDKKIGRISFTKVTVENITVANNNVIIDAVLKINNKDIRTRIETKHLNYTGTKDLNVMYVSPTSSSTLNTIKKGKNTQLFFYYLASNPGIEMKDLQKFCNDPEIKLSQRDICSSALSLKMSDAQVNIESYINDIVNSYTGDRVVLDKLIFDFVMIDE